MTTIFIFCRACVRDPVFRSFVRLCVYPYVRPSGANICDQPSVHPTVQVLYSEILWDTLTKLCTGIKHWGSDSVNSWRIFPNLICDIFLLFVITYALCHLYGDSYEMPQCSFIERYKNYLKYSQGLLRNPEGTFLCQNYQKRSWNKKNWKRNQNNDISFKRLIIFPFQYWAE